jgi:two-component sensor histidine kinase
MNRLHRLLRKGVENAVDPFDARRILLLNLFFCVGTLTLLAALIQSLIVQEPPVMSAVLAAATVLLIGVPLIGRRNPNLGTVYILLLSNLLVWFFANSQGLGAGTYFYYFPLFFANGWLMDFRKPWNACLLVMMTFAGVIAVLLIPESVFGLSIPKDVQEASFIFNLTASSVIMALNTLVIVWMNYRRQQEIEERIGDKERIMHQLTVALKQKEVLLAEIHHRVKNNLAVVRGLLNMQMNTTSNEDVKATLRESVNRVTTMALIHEKLYTRKNPDSIDLSGYVNELVREIASSYHQQGGTMPEVHTDIKDISLTLNRAVPCGLILNEFLSNAYKHAFRKDQRGIINISVTPDTAKRGYVNMVVADNGKGIPAGFDPDTSATLGITIIQSLTDQLDGTFTFDSSPKGTAMQVNFPVDVKQKL